MKIGENIVQYNFPTVIRFGKGASDEIGPHLLSVGKKRALIVSDPGLTGLSLFEKIMSKISQQKLEGIVFSSIDKNPIEKNVLDGVEAYKQQDCDCIIGLGGGASMDVARAIALKVNHDRDLFDFDDSKGGDKYVVNDIPYFVTVPTTSGTGSEVGRSTVISDDITKQKKVLFSPELMAKRVFADPELTMELPSFITAATGMDALSHNLEAYFSKGFSPMCDGIALEGIRLIFDSIEKASSSADLESRSKMMMAALMGATAFQKGLGIVHSMAHPLSTLYDTHHGLANALMLRYGVEFNANACEDRIRNICQLIGIEPSVDCFLSHLESLNKSLDMPLNFKEAGIIDPDIDQLSKLALEDACHQCNPIPVTLEDFKSIYTKALG
ncbi:MAG: iron-containing alcohol dehydrogenase [Bdellovibrionales bacterium]|nr:iron-containing alcohol dehydrogenase [Bdellovibrionales bacterium]